MIDWTKVPNWRYAVRKDDSIYIVIGDPATGPHQQFDFHGTEDLAKLFCRLPDLLDAEQKLKLADKALEHIAHGGEKARYVAALNLSLIREGSLPAPAIDCKTEEPALAR
jgi:hypothetical protein